MPESHILALSMAGTALFGLFMGAIILLTVRFRNRLNEHYLEKQQLLTANLEEGERLMNQVAREVHDNVGQIAHLLYTTNCRIKKIKERQEQEKLIDHANYLTDLIINNADNIQQSLNSDFLKSKGLCIAIDHAIQLIERSIKVRCNLDIIGEPKRMPADTELVIYRIAQEAFHNVLKHSGASFIDIILQFTRDSFLMRVKDYGIGFYPEDAEKKGRSGLTNMQQRANRLNAVLEIESAPGNGCTIKLAIADPYLPET